MKVLYALVVAIPLLSMSCTSELLPIGDSGGPEDASTDSDTDRPDRDTDVDTSLGDGNMEWVRGDLTWSVDFDAAAEAAGFVDCEYVRHYEAGEDLAHQWLCPDCERMFRADVSFVSGRADCYDRVTDATPTPNELIGLSGSTWMRSRSYTSVLRQIGTSDVGGRTWTLSASGTSDHSGGGLSFTIGGTLERSRRDGDLMHGWSPPETYRCGWPSTSAPAYTGDYELVVGEAMPDITLLDICNEPVRLYDLFDGYTVLYSGAPDCVTCRDMASGHNDFDDEVAGLPWTAKAVGIVAPSLQDADGETSLPVLSAWISAFQLQDKPVFRDRGFAFAVLGDVYPTTVVIAPDGTVVDVAQGYTGSWDYWGLQIDQHVHGQD
ncbi:MAG: hypothetical protein ACI855_003046 [Myxococcota bacterium]|jgi:hypothetical protein